MLLDANDDQDTRLDGLDEEPKEPEFADPNEDSDFAEASDEDDSSGKDDGKDGEDNDASGDDDSPAISDMVLDRAVRAGVDRVDAAQFRNEASLIRVIESLESKAPTAEDAGNDQGKADENSSFTLDIDPDAYSEDVVKVFKQLEGVINKQESRIRELSTQRDTSTHRVELDEFVSALGKSWQEKLGKGATSALKPGSEELRNRNAVLDDARVIARGYEASGQKPPPMSELLNRALNGRFSDHIKKQARDSIGEKVRGRRGQFVARAADKGRKLSPRQKAIRNAGRRMADIGMTEFGDD